MRLRHGIFRFAVSWRESGKLNIQVLKKSPGKSRGLILLVGVEGFEPPASCSQSRRATSLRHTPSIGLRTSSRPGEAVHSGAGGGQEPFRIRPGRSSTVRPDSRCFARTPARVSIPTEKVGRLQVGQPKSTPWMRCPQSEHLPSRMPRTRAENPERLMSSLPQPGQTVSCLLEPGMFPM